MTAIPITTDRPPASAAIVRAAIAKVNALATLPEVTARIISTVQDPKSSAFQLHRIVSHDPALVSRILKIVNSAYYGFPGQVASIERAIVLLGLNAVENIAMAASLGRLFRGMHLCGAFTARDLWQHCIAVAVTARLLSQETGSGDAEEAFLAGLIHDVGIVVELQNWPEQIRGVCQKMLKTPGDFCQSERAALGVDHQLLGQALAQHWTFPQSLQDAAGFHHDFRQAPEGSWPLVRLIHVADVWCCQSKQGFALTAATESVEGGELAEMGLDQAKAKEMLAGLPALIQSAASIFT